MKTFFIALVAVVGLTIVNVGTAEAFGGRRRTQVTYVPAPAGTTAQTQPSTGYRSYSYQPGTYQPASSYQSSSRTPIGGFHDAGWKIRGGN